MKSICDTGRLVKWLEIGQSESGEFMGIRDVKFPERVAEFADFIDKDGAEFAIPLGADLKRKIPRIPIGTFVKVTWTGEKSTGHGTMKVFLVEVGDEVEVLQPTRKAAVSGTASVPPDDVLHD